MFAARTKVYTKKALAPIRDYLEFRRLPEAAKAALRADMAGLPNVDPGADAAIVAALNWLGCAQDFSRSNDGGVARHYSLITGWAASYPETTGYIVPTLLEQAALRRDASLRERARRMLDWLVSIQFPEGGFQGGVVGLQRPVPVTFNTGQILLGLAAGAREFGDLYRVPMQKAADWLVGSQDPDGCWRKHRTPFASPEDKVYETHVSWGLFEAARVGGNPAWGEAGLRQVRWALTKQRANGWMDDCCLRNSSSPLTHTLGYALRGILEAWRFSQSDDFLAAGKRLGDGLLTAQRPDGSLPGELKSDWSPGVRWICLTGLVQIAHCWLILFEATGEPRYRDAALAANAFVRRTVSYDGPPDIRGGVKGSFPVDGNYGKFEYLNWAAKFFIDSNQAELDLDRVSGARPSDQRLPGQRLAGQRVPGLAPGGMTPVKSPAEP